MEEASHLCDRLVIMDQGKILTCGSPEELISKYAGREVMELRLDPEERKKAVIKRFSHLVIEGCRCI